VRLVRNLLALIGILALIAVGAAIMVVEPYVSQSRSLDKSAPGIYAGVAKTILTTGDAMQALVYQRRVVPGRDAGDVERSLEEAAAEFGLHSLGVLRVDREIRERTGGSFPLLQIHLFCDAGLAVDLMQHNSGMAAYLPCRVTLYEDVRGGLWVMTSNLDLLVHGGRPLPTALQERAGGVQAALRKMVDRAAGAEVPKGTEARNKHPLAGFSS
jgi:uncharacterized protein (DUF302 family)